MKIINSSNIDSHKVYFRNFDRLIKSIKTHIKKNPKASIVQDDKPREITIGYKDKNSTRRWYVTVPSLKRWVSYQSEPKRSLIKEAFMTSEGKENLIKSFYM